MLHFASTLLQSLWWLKAAFCFLKDELHVKVQTRALLWAPWPAGLGSSGGLQVSCARQYKKQTANPAVLASPKAIAVLCHGGTLGYLCLRGIGGIEERRRSSRKSHYIFWWFEIYQYDFLYFGRRKKTSLALGSCKWTNSTRSLYGFLVDLAQLQRTRQL